jgi:hypothetical protein
MERLQELISKLKEQFEENAPASQLLLTTQLIQSELFRMHQQPAAILGTAKVAVVMPTAMKINLAQPILSNEPAKEILEEKPKMTVQPVKSQPEDHWAYNKMSDIPTLAQHRPPKELNDSMGNDAVSLNEKLKADTKELANSLKHSPVQDLKKAIGINDRYLFISELFRGDEVMYERSIKTINSFRVLSEAEYWMERELKVKLGWENGKNITQHFYDVVKRRFA